MPYGISTPGGSSRIVGPVVSTVNRHCFVVREPGKLPVALALQQMLAVRQRVAVEDEAAFGSGTRER